MQHTHKINLALLLCIIFFKWPLALPSLPVKLCSTKFSCSNQVFFSFPHLITLSFRSPIRFLACPLMYASTHLRIDFFNILDSHFFFIPRGYISSIKSFPISQFCMKYTWKSRSWRSATIGAYNEDQRKVLKNINYNYYQHPRPTL